MKIPSEDACFKLIRKMEMLEHIIDHSRMVSKVTRFLCEHLVGFSPNLDLMLATRAALLHDITKTRSFQTREIHSETGGLLLTEMGYPEVGDIIRQHVILDEYTKTLPICETEIVNYSDKRVLHDRIVSLSDRLHYIKERYGKMDEFRERVQILCDKTQILEDKLFFYMGFHPDKLAQKMAEFGQSE